MLAQLRLASEMQEAERVLARVVELEQTTTAELRKRLHDLLEKLTAVARDCDLWDRLADAAAEPLPVERLNAMLGWATADLAPMLEAFGYRVPPPPPAREMVERTVIALKAVRTDDDQRRRVEEARLDLMTFGMRVRNQVEPTSLYAGPGKVRVVARRVCARAREIAPVVIAVGVAGVFAEDVVNEVGVFLSKSGEKRVELGVHPFATLVAGLGMRWRIADRDEHLDPVTLHLTALFAGINGLRAGDRGETTDPHVHAEALKHRLWKQGWAQSALDSAFGSLDAAFVELERVGQEGCARAVAGLEAAAWELHDALSPPSTVERSR
ncbi:hypothetical protein SK803_03575 [Lentzea sp. BCCO 10_0856]|uniref:Uncharacterized protein n=1 Tax=Lentzea miocenica TaxID=3095431 RepID=A0ABU4STR6_9PSEU|nr:hypothetical protein [Lentzea sp. BCCO 10_0856]MDX8029271.1 hypothetical protein [Lentzea sp. BCCO 10_0856]